MRHSAFSIGIGAIATWKVKHLLVDNSIQQRLISLLLLALCLQAAPSFADVTSSASPQSSQSDSPTPPLNLAFVRAFSSSDDVRLPRHPVLDRTIDIIAGPADPVTRMSVLRSPSAIATDSSHRIFVADFGAGAVHIFDFVSSRYSLLDKGSDRLGAPVSLAVDDRDNLYVIDARSRSILVYDSSGKFRGHLGKLRGKESYFDSPAGIAIDRTNGHIYVSDWRRHMIFILDQKGRLIRKIGKRSGAGDGPSEFTEPTQLAAGGGELFVLDTGNTRVQVFDAAGRFLRQIDLIHTDRHTGIAIDSHANLYVSDPSFNRIQIFRHDGSLLSTFDATTISTATFSRPSALWIEAGHCLYVADSENHRIGLFQINLPNAAPCQ
jgi:sugar lactone lactonase YvrE